MALPYQVYNLTPNLVDGKQRMSDWDGTLDTGTALPAPTNFRVTSYGSDFINYAWDYTDTQHKNFTLDMSVPPAGFTPRTTTIPPGDRTYRATASPNTYTGARIRATAPDVPDPVTDLSGVATSSTTVQLSWTAIAGADEYNIQRAPNNGLWSTIDATASTAYDDAGLTASSPYQYRIFTAKEGDWGDVSNTISVTTQASGGGGITDLSKITKSVNWDSLPDGTGSNELPGVWRGNGDNTGYLTSEPANMISGQRKTCVQVIPVGKGGLVDQYGYWGFGVPLGGTYSEGDEIWLRFYEKFHADWKWNDDSIADWLPSNANKWIRLRREGEAHSEFHYGYEEGVGLPNTLGWSDGYSWFSCEGLTQGLMSPVDVYYEGQWWRGGWDKGQTQDKINQGGFDCYEAYIRLTAAKTESTKPIAAFWKNGQRVGTVMSQGDELRSTMQNSSTVVEQGIIHTVWKGWVDTDQYSYIGGIAVAVRRGDGSKDDTTSMGIDAQGFPMIGTVI